MTRWTRFLSAFCCISLLAGLLAAPSQAADPEETDDTAVIVIDPDRVQGSVPSTLIGINHRVNNDGEGTWNEETGTIPDEFLNVYRDIGFGTIRYPGGTIANYFDWKKAIGQGPRPAEVRNFSVTGISDSANFIANFGVDELLELLKETGNSVNYMYNFANGTAQNALELFYYISGRRNSADSQEAYWANLRYENTGFEEPFVISALELGNELEGAGTVGSGVPTWYNASYGSYLGGDPEYHTAEDPYWWLYVNGGLMDYADVPAVDYDDYHESKSYGDGTDYQRKYMVFGTVRVNDSLPGRYAGEGLADVRITVAGEPWIQVSAAALAKAGPDERLYAVEGNDILFGGEGHGRAPGEGEQIRVSYVSHGDGLRQYCDLLGQAANRMGTSIKIYSCVVQESAMKYARDIDYAGIAVHPYVGSPLHWSSGISVTNAGDWESETAADRLAFHDAQQMLGQVTYDWVEQVVWKNLMKYTDPAKYQRDIIITEYGIQANGSDMGSDYCRSVSSAVLTAGLLLDFYNGLNVGLIDRHCLSTNIEDNHGSVGRAGQALLDIDDLNGYAVYPGASAYGWELLANYLGTQKLGATVLNMPEIACDTSLLSSPGPEMKKMMEKMGRTPADEWIESSGYQPTGRYGTLHTLATRKEDGSICLIVVNTSSGAQSGAVDPVEIRVPGYIIDTAEISSLWNEDIMAFNTRTTPKEVAITGKRLQIGADCFLIDIPYCSITAFRLHQAQAYTDVPRDTWCFADVMAATRAGLMNGMGGRAFGPDLDLNRGMAATLLYRLAGSSAGEEPFDFTDVPADSYYARAVAWVCRQGLTEGITETVFAPEKQVSRQDFALMLYRYARIQGIDLSAEDELKGFSDDAGLSDEAKAAMGWAMRCGLLESDAEGRLEPDRVLKRGETAGLLNRIANMLAYPEDVE